MPLKNEQYNRILREYDKRQLKNRRILKEKLEAIYASIPAIKELDEEIAKNAVRATRLTLEGNEEALDELKQVNQGLSEDKKALLLAHHFPEDYLTLSYTCPDCKDTGYITETDWPDEDHVLLSRNKCHCFKQAIVDLLYAQSGIHNAIAKENFSTFSYDYFDRTKTDAATGMTAYDNMVRVVASCQKFIQNFDDTFENILFYGNAGVGKTFLTNCIAKELLESAHTVIYLTAFQLFDILEKHKFSKEDSDETDEQFAGILDCDLLIIDDLGTELSNTFINSQLYLCINERQLSEKSTIISTNLPLDDLSERYSERIFSRITSNYTILKLFGDDIRVRKALQISPNATL